MEFAQSAQPVSVLSHTGGDNTNIVAVHSLSKRSSMAGYRAAFMIGDSALIARIREIRKHGGMMVPLPVQKAMTVALADDKHVAEQRARYNARKDALLPALEAAAASYASAIVSKSFGRPYWPPFLPHNSYRPAWY